MEVRCEGTRERQPGSSLWHRLARCSKEGPARIPENPLNTMPKTTTQDRKLPISFFEVLDQEYAALHNVPTTKFSWDFAPDQLKGAIADFLKKIAPLLAAAEFPKLPNTCSKEELTS